MGKISTVISKSVVQSPNLELSSSVVQNNTNPQTKKAKKVKKVINQSSQTKSLTVFKKLIILTTFIFSFGGLGFGFGLRYSNLFQTYQSHNVPLNHLSE